MADVVEGARVVVPMRVGEALYGVAVDDVVQVVRAPRLTAVPHVPRAVRGVASVRGEILPVVDLGTRLHDRPVAEDGRLVVVRLPRTGESVGLLVDGVEGLMTGEGDADAPQETVTSLPAGMVEGVVRAEGRAPVALLSLSAVLDGLQAEGESG